MNSKAAGQIKRSQIMNVVYVGPFFFPNGGAAARRVLGVSKALQKAGFMVQVACGQKANKEKAMEWFEGIEVFSLNERTADHLPQFFKYLAYLTIGRRTITWLNSLKQKPEIVILYSGYSPYLFHLLPWARRNNIKLVFDAVEWYDPPSTLGWLSPYQLNIEFAMRFLLPRVGRVISISNYLNCYSIARGCQSVVVPPALDVVATAPRISGRKQSRPLKLVYAGSPGHKDLFNDILEAVLRLQNKGCDLHLSVAGILPEEVRRYKAVQCRSYDDVCSSGVEFVGRVNHAASLELVRKADFSILLRADSRNSKAGFSTKFVESFAVGTPVIANLTGDLHRYLRDNDTGILCKAPSIEGLEKALLRALALNKDEHSAMRARCREVAIASFDYRLFSTLLSEFLQQ
jgi:glycosyltransferase involved in cell wall biosynthesis